MFPFLVVDINWVVRICMSGLLCVVLNVLLLYIQNNKCKNKS